MQTVMYTTLENGSYLQTRIRLYKKETKKSSMPPPDESSYEQAVHTFYKPFICHGLKYDTIFNLNNIFCVMGFIMLTPFTAIFHTSWPSFVLNFIKSLNRKWPLAYLAVIYCNILHVSCFNAVAKQTNFICIIDTFDKKKSRILRNNTPIYPSSYHYGFLKYFSFMKYDGDIWIPRQKICL